MSNGHVIRFHNTHTLAFSQEAEMNERIRQSEHYAEGARVTGHNWNKATDTVQFYYSIPEGLDPSAENELEQAMKKIISDISGK